MTFALFVGGAFNPDGGRTSGYFGKLSSALCEALPQMEARVINGGSFDHLRAAMSETGNISHLLWFADVPNDLPKLLPALKERCPGLVLVSSKNNRRKLYSREALFERMRHSRSEFLVEFGEGQPGVLVASVLAAHGQILLDSSPDIATIAGCLAAQFNRLRSLHFPLPKMAFPTTDGESFRNRDLHIDAEIPLGAHPGAFGAIRRHHIHEGVDLYGLPGDPVFAIEPGMVVARGLFTGPAVGSPWWGETEYVLVEGESGVLNYGEVLCDPSVRVGGRVTAGQKIGALATVLLKDKGRPQTMLHLERYAQGTLEPIKEWASNSPRPANLCDPTALLLQAGKRDLT